MGWIYLVGAILFEMGWAIGLKYSQQTKSWWLTGVTVAVMIGSFVLLQAAVRTIPLGTAYAIWTGIGAAGVAIYGMFWFGEPRDPLRVVCLVLIVAGAMGLKLFSTSTS